MGIFNKIRKTAVQNKSNNDLNVEGGVKEKEGNKTKKLKNNKCLKSNNVIIRPLVTEKSAYLNEGNKYSFVVDQKSNKIDIKNSILDIYKVMPININIINMKGKKVQRNGVKGKRVNWKKAVVSLPKNKKINIYEGL